MKQSVLTFKKMKEDGKKISMLTAYDYSTAKLMDEAGIHGILVGDSLGNVMLGYEDTIPVTMQDMITTMAITTATMPAMAHPQRSFPARCTI